MHYTDAKVFRLNDWIDGREIELGQNTAWLEQVALVQLMAAGKIGEFDDVGFRVIIHVSPDDTMH